MATINVSVTQEDIDHGAASCCFSCPVAKAIARHLAKGWHPSVVGFYVKFYPARGEPLEGVTDLPQEVDDFVTAFDKGRPVSPITFPLDVPDDLLAPEPAATE